MEFLIWIAMLIVYSILTNKKKKGAKNQQSPQEVLEMPTLEDALREISEALQSRPTQEPVALPEPEPQRPVKKPKKKVVEPEFHSLESDIKEHRLESKTRYSERILETAPLESQTTYEDSFPESKFFDDTYRHAHMEASDRTTLLAPKKQEDPASLIRSKLKDKNYLAEAFVIQQILGDPVSKKRMK